MALTVKDLKQLQADYPDYQMELVDGNIVIMGPSDFVSEEIIGRLVTFLNVWVLPRKLGRVAGSSAGFNLPNSDLRAPDVCFVRAERLRQSPRSFAELVPDLMVEVKSATDRLRPLREKIEQFLELGAQVGVLIDPDKQTVTVYRPNQNPILLTNNDKLSLPDLLPGWEIAVSELWPPVFE